MKFVPAFLVRMNPDSISFDAEGAIYWDEKKIGSIRQVDSSNMFHACFLTYREKWGIRPYTKNLNSELMVVAQWVLKHHSSLVWIELDEAQAILIDPDFLNSLNLSGTEPAVDEEEEI